MVDLIPSWAEVAANYPYAPGSQEMSKEDWKALRQADKEARAQARKAQKEARELARLDKKWGEMEDDMLVQDSSELPDRTPWWRFDQRIENPQTKTDVAMATGAGIARPFTWLGEQLAKLALGKDEVEDADYAKWREQYLTSGGGSGNGAGLGLGLGVGADFPKLTGYVPNWAELEKDLEASQSPEYQEEAFNPWNTVANMLMNADWINMDMSRAGRVMQDAFNRRAKNNADVANANAQAKAEEARWKAARKLALEELKAKSAMQQAELALQSWKMQQPQALGGNKLFWRDSAGNPHFEQIDKQSEARTVGANIAMSDILNSKKKLTPKQIAKKAQAAAMLYPDANKVPFINGYMLQAMQMQQTEE